MLVGSAWLVIFSTTLNTVSYEVDAKQIVPVLYALGAYSLFFSAYLVVGITLPGAMLASSRSGHAATVETLRAQYVALAWWLFGALCVSTVGLVIFAAVNESNIPLVWYVLIPIAGIVGGSGCIYGRFGARAFAEADRVNAMTAVVVASVCWVMPAFVAIALPFGDGGRGSSPVQTSMLVIAMLLLLAVLNVVVVRHGLSGGIVGGLLVFFLIAVLFGSVTVPAPFAFAHLARFRATLVLKDEKKALAKLLDGRCADIGRDPGTALRVIVVSAVGDRYIVRCNGPDRVTYVLKDDVAVVLP